MCALPQAIQVYDAEHTVKASTAMDNPDGSKYRDHKLSCTARQAVKESSNIMHAPQGAVKLLKATYHVTVSIVLPVIGRLLHILHPDTVVKWVGQTVPSQSEMVQHGPVTSVRRSEEKVSE
ncbi:hypothetical protein CYMTET_7925 [Cymbomonas tetramitiformis]|uniref:Uncharacterized protein n=1 Tax=Cymbomonas tetramitiformis TaxID=36881 RepID=A0AAE0GU20_9CHLO|nr:hypothetical protein CYMTET_7925 [Cymbomonas tetramitiformis]